MNNVYSPFLVKSLNFFPKSLFNLETWNKTNEKKNLFIVLPIPEEKFHVIDHHTGCKYRLKVSLEYVHG